MHTPALAANNKMVVVTQIRPSFPALEKRITKAIKQLGGAVFPKLNWSAPRDVSWITNDASLKCTTPGDVYLLLKSSEFVTHDITKRIRRYVHFYLYS